MIELSKETKYGVNATKWKITDINIKITEKKIYVGLAGYADETKEPLTTERFEINFTDLKCITELEDFLYDEIEKD